MPKNRTQRLTFPKHSNMSAASSTDFVLHVRYTNVSAVDLVIWLAFRLSKARLSATLLAQIIVVQSLSAGCMNLSSESESERWHTATRMQLNCSESNMQRCTHCNKSEVFAKMLHILHIYAEYAVYAVYAQYAPSHILHICCISSIRTPGRPPKTYPGQGAYLPFFAYI